MKTIEEQILEHAQSEYPNECCGIVVNDNGSQRYIPCKNVADDPLNFFEISPEETAQIYIRYEPIAIVHSHPDCTSYLSTQDRQCQVHTGIDWWLVCEGKIYKYRNVQPLLGRDFEHGVSDCYTLFRDCYTLSGVELPDFERENEWWWHGQNLYLDNLEKHGFFKVEKPERGDIILMQIQSDVPNHVGVYLGDQMFLHHICNRLSKRDIYGSYWLNATHSIWRYKWKSQLNFTAILNDLEMSL
ncbi:TPA: C40 family peptidase [Haemophilus influenzae]